jgi:predicted Rossmann fold nucleotide-binding protein DprA/Smf involved in DNA uptake
MTPATRPGRTNGHRWLDAAAGPVVRPYTLTRGRAEPVAGGLDLVALVVATGAAAEQRSLELEPEHRAILALGRRPTSVAEIAARLDLPLGVVRVLLGDLRQHGLVAVYEPADADRYRVLKAVADGLRAL